MHTTVDVGVPTPRLAAVPCPKVRVPRASTTLVLRPRLLGLLSDWATDDTGRDIACLCGPAGSGKTTLLAEWARRQRKQAGACVAWVSLEDEDNEVHGLWSAVLAAVDATTSGGSPVAGLAAPAHGFTPVFLTALLEAFEGPGPQTILVLDDVHEIRDQETLHSLDLLLRRLPSRLKVVMSARFAPALALARLGLEGRVLGIDAAALAFTEPEATALLGGHDVQLDPEALGILLERTEGWAAGLRLAAMSLARAEDPSALIASFAGDDRAVADYFVGEVLARQDGPTRQFLLDTSITSRITPDLARRLSGREDAGALLDDLERSNSFVVRLGGREDWYRHHPMLRQYLVAELSRQSFQQVAVLHRRAARWFADHDEPMAAIEHAVAADDPDLTAVLLGRYGVRHILRGEGSGLRRVLGRAGAPVARRPEVALVSAATALEVGDHAAADAALGAAPDLDTAASGSPQLRGLHTLVTLQRARLAGDRAAVSGFVRGVPASTGDPDLDLLLQVHRGAALTWLGEVDAAGTVLDRALPAARGTGCAWVLHQCLGHLTTVALARSDMPAVTVRAQEAVALAAAQGWTDGAPQGSVALARGWAGYQLLDHEVVLAAVPAVRALSDDPDPGTALSVAVFTSVVDFEETENRHDLVAGLREAWHVCPDGHLPRWAVASSALIEQRMALQVGEPAWAGEVVERTERLLGDCGEVRVLHAVGQTHRGRTDSARRLLSPVVTGEVSCLVPLSLVEAWVWDARLSGRAGDGARAHRSVVEALVLAGSHGLLRPFVAGGQELHDLLAQGAGRFGRLEALAERVRAATAGRPEQQNLELLTARELELLVELPSMRTAEEIASSMFVSVNTVKTHLRGIYRKLGVANRREAILLARRRGLI